MDYNKILVFYLKKESKRDPILIFHILLLEGTYIIFFFHTILMHFIFL